MIALVAALLVAQALPPAPAPDRAAQENAAAAERGPVVAVRPSSAKPPSLWSRAGTAIERTVRRLWEKDEPHATEGNMASLNGEVDQALHHYDEAEKDIPANSEAAATLAFDRSTAMMKGPPEMAQKALEEARTARENGGAALRAKAAYNEGVALEAEGKPDEAIKAYANALSLDSDDVDSKVNLELLLKEHQKKQPQAGQQDKDKEKQPQQDDKDKEKQQAQAKQDDKKDQKKDEQKQEGNDPEKKDQQQSKSDEKQQAKPDEKKQQEAQQGKEGQEQDKQGEKPKEEEQPQASLGRSEAQRLLDAARAGEKNLQMWRFGKQADQHKQRSSAEKDW